MSLTKLLVLILLYPDQELSGLEYPLNNMLTYMYLKPSNSSNKVDTSNPWRFDFLDTRELIELWGYKGEEHKVTSEDGYIISIYRILPKADNSPPVLLMHGLLVCSESWVLRGKSDLAIILTDAGYDVWLGNLRGNYNGRGHVNLTANAEDENFWKFSFHEMGYYDLPAFVDHILDTTGFSQLTIIGHSMANAVTMIMTSMKPEYNDKINIYVGMAPFVFADHLPRGPIFNLALRLVTNYCFRVRKFEILERRSINPIVRFCDITPMGCAVIFLFILGITDINYDLDLVSTINGYFPSGTSIFNMIHLLDLYRRGSFSQFDHGRTENLIRYNSEEPPEYDLSRVTIPVVLFSGAKDILIDRRDVTRFEKSLSNLVGSYMLESYNHFDVVIASDAKEVFYDRIVDIIGKYQQRPQVDVSSTRRPPRSPG